MNYIGEKWFDTLNTIQADCDRNLLVEAMKLCPYYDGLFNRMNPDSDLYRLNHSRGELTWVHEEVKEVLRMAQEIYEASGHTFNVAVGSLVQLWKQAAKNQRLPSQLQREQAIAEADFSKVCIENEGIQMPVDMELDLGGIAKGYIVDQLAQYLRDHGVTSALLNFGGNMKTIGTRPDGTPWKIRWRSLREKSSIRLV